MKNGDYVITNEGAIGTINSLVRWEVGHYIDEKWTTKKNCASKQEADSYIEEEQAKTSRLIEVRKINTVLNLGGNLIRMGDSSFKLLDKIGIDADCFMTPIYFNLETEFTQFKQFLYLLNFKNIKFIFVS